MKLLNLISFLILTSQPALGQGLYGKFLDHKQGLLSKECYDINFNKEGYLIVGTQYGPMKYDGEKFTSICLNLPIERRIIYDFEKDPQGQIYLLNSKNELFILKGDRAIQLNSKKTCTIPNHVHFTKLHWYSKGLMIFSNDIYYRYLFKHKTLSANSNRQQDAKNLFVCDLKKEFPFEKCLSIILNLPKHTILFKSPQKKLLIKKQLISHSREDFIKIGNTHFVIISNNLYRIDPSKITILPYEDILFIEFFHNRIWLATDNGLIELDRNGNFIHTHFPNQVIGGVAPLPDKGIAVSLNLYGVFICSNIDERFYNNSVPSEIASNNNTIIIGNRRGELFHFKNNSLLKIQNSMQLNQADTSIHLKKIRRIEFNQNKWYICSINGIYSLSGNLKKRKIVRLDQFYSFNDFFFSKENIYSISWSDIRSINSSRKLKNKVDIPLIRCRYQLNDSVVLLGSEEGLFEFHVTDKKLIRSPFFQKPFYISHIQKLSSNEFLISSRYKGIFHFKNGKLIKRYESPCISLKKALISGRQIIAAGNQGIYIKPFKSGRKVFWKKIFEKEIQNLFLIGQKLFICSDDDLITKKINYQTKLEKPSIVLNEILLGDLKIRELPKEINYNVPISLDFDILYFGANKLKLYYRLNGESRSIQYTEGTRLSFEALPSGDYQLEIFPVIDGKIQFSNSKNYQFTINEPFWQSTLFYILISIVVLLMLFSIRLIRNLQRKKRIAERAELESKLNEYKLLAVKAQVNPHFLSNGLAAIQALILKGDNDHAAHYLAKFSFLMRKILYYSDTQFISIQQELQLADAYLELELLRSKNRFKIDKQIDLSEAELATFKIPSLLLQPILENAIWHGLKFQENNPELLMLLQLTQNRILIIEISDNGPGFNSNNKTEEHLSKGNKLITERIDTLNKQFQKQVARMDVLSSSAGTKVIFSFTSELYQPE